MAGTSTARLGEEGIRGAILEAAPGVEVIALDRDPDAASRAEMLSKEFPGKFVLRIQNFADLSTVDGPAFDGILFDFGLSSFQIDDPQRGFSFRSDGPADMRMDRRSGIPAAQWLETATEEMLVSAIRDLGEEPHWRRVVRALLGARRTGALARTSSLSEVISQAIPVRERHASRIHPATRSFQGLRIALNNEIGAIQLALYAAFEVLRPAGVLCAISFHSLEDRPVKQYFRRLCGQPENAEDSLPQDLRTRTAEALTGRPVIPSDGEIEANPRSRSAKLRAIRKL